MRIGFVWCVCDVVGSRCRQTGPGLNKKLFGARPLFLLTPRPVRRRLALSLLLSQKQVLQAPNMPAGERSPTGNSNAHGGLDRPQVSAGRCDRGVSAEAQGGLRVPAVSSRWIRCRRVLSETPLPPIGAAVAHSSNSRPPPKLHATGAIERSPAAKTKKRRLRRRSTSHFLPSTCGRRACRRELR